MLSSKLPGPWCALRTLATGFAVLAVTCIGSAPPAQADDSVAPVGGELTITGSGWGHGRGMSQYGAYGAATKGLDHAAILAFYYPGTTLDALGEGNTVRVWISADDDAKLHFRPAAGLQVRDADGTILTLPTGSKYTKWRITRSGSKRVLYYRNKAGKYVKYATKLSSSEWFVTNPKSGVVGLALPSGSTVKYRGRLALGFTPNGTRTINHVAMEDYLRSVVPAEMPASWAAEALRAQAVAARSYAARLRSQAGSGAGYDLCDTSACQVYKGTGWEYPSTDAAIKATADQILTYQGRPALTEFSSSNGGWSAAGGSGYPYLKAKQDPYDGVKRDQSWRVTVTAAKLAKLFGGIGSIESVQVTARDGNGLFGGRVETVRIVGSSGRVSVTGATFKSRLGLRERLFAISGGTPNTLVTTLGLSGPVADAYAAAGEAATKLGAQTSDVITTDTGSYADFEGGRITCPTGGECVVSYR